MKKGKKKKAEKVMPTLTFEPHPWASVDLDWDTYPREERKRRAIAALKAGDLDTLWDLTRHNMLLYGRGGSHTSDHTLRAYRTGVGLYLRYALPLGWQRIVDHDTDLTVGYLRALERTHLTPGTINARRTAARALYRALRWAGVMQGDPFADTPRVADTTDPWAKREAYTREDIAALMAVADPDEQLMLLLGAHAALRMSEMTGLTWERIDLERRIMTVTGKGRKTARVHLSGPLHAALTAVPEDARTGYVLPWRNAKSVRMLLRALCNLAGVTYERRQVHGLRHAAATMLLEQTGDIYVVSRHLRHSTIGTTEIYAKMRPQRLTEALDAWVE